MERRGAREELELELLDCPSSAMLEACRVLLCRVVVARQSPAAVCPPPVFAAQASRLTLAPTDSTSKVEKFCSRRG